MAARVELREISNEEGNRLLRMIRRSSGSVVTWRRAQMVLLAAQRMPPTRIAGVVFSDPDTVREVIHNFNRDGFDALYPRYRGGRPRSFTLPQRQAITRIALSVPSDLGQPFASWSLAKLADYLVSEEVVDDISHEGLRQLLREEGVSFQAVRSRKRSNDPAFEQQKNRILELYAIADGLAEPAPDDPDTVICLDEFGPLNLQPQPGGKAWAPRAKPRRIRATYTRPHGVRHGALNRGFMEVIPRWRSKVRIPTDPSGREHELPSPVAGSVGKLPFQCSRKNDASEPLREIRLMHCAHAIEMLQQRIADCLRQHDAPILLTLSPADHELPAIESRCL